MKILIAIIIALFIWDVPLVGPMIRHILMIIVGIMLLMRVPDILRGIFSPKRVM